jgi:DNA-binding NarL/FixJ family response regulator
MADALRIVIAEDNYLVREGTRRLLEGTGEVTVVAAVGSAPELLDAVARLAPDAVLTDIRMPPGNGTDGIDAAHEIRAAHPHVGVVVLSQYADGMYAFELFKHGTAGLAYLLKDRVADSGQIVTALREALAGGSVIDPQVVEGLVLGQQSAQQTPLAELTDRERDVLRLMAEGRSNGGIAAALYLSESSVEKHVGSIFGKLGLQPEPATHRRVAAVLAFLRGLRD